MAASALVACSSPRARLLRRRPFSPNALSRALASPSCCPCDRAGGAKENKTPRATTHAPNERIGKLQKADGKLDQAKICLSIESTREGLLLSRKSCVASVVFVRI